MRAKVRVKVILPKGEKIWHLIDPNTCTTVKKFLRLLKRKHGSSENEKFQAHIDEFLLPRDSPMELIRDGDLIRVTCKDKKPDTKFNSRNSNTNYLDTEYQYGGNHSIRAHTPQKSDEEAELVKANQIESVEENKATINELIADDSGRTEKFTRDEQAVKRATSSDHQQEKTYQIYSQFDWVSKSESSSEDDEVVKSKRQKLTLDYTPIEKQLIEEFNQLKRPKRKRKHKRKNKKQPEQVEQKEITIKIEPAPMNCSYDGTKTVFPSDNDEEKTTPVDNCDQRMENSAEKLTTCSEVTVNIKQEDEISSASDEDFADSWRQSKHPATSSSTPRNNSQITNKSELNHSLPSQTPVRLSTSERTPARASVTEISDQIHKSDPPTSEQSIEKPKSIIKQTTHKNGVTVFKRVTKPKLRATISPAIFDELKKSAQQNNPSSTAAECDYHEDTTISAVYNTQEKPADLKYSQENTTPVIEKTTPNTEKKITWHNGQKLNQLRKDVYTNKSRVLTSLAKHHQENGPTRHHDISTRHEGESTCHSDKIALLEKKLFYMRSLTDQNNTESKISELEQELKVLKGKGDKSKSAGDQIDFTQYPSMRNTPRIHDVIAFKVLEINEANFTPVISEYKTGTVTEIDEESKNITIQLDNSNRQNTFDNRNSRLQKFDVKMEEYVTEFNPQDSLRIHADNLIDIRLVI